MQCMKYVPALSVTLGTYTLTDHFFLVEIPDTNVILGIQWLITMGKVTTDWETLQMEWIDKKSGNHQMIRGMHTYPLWEASAHNMEPDFCSGSRDTSVPSDM